MDWDVKTAYTETLKTCIFEPLQQIVCFPRSELVAQTIELSKPVCPKGGPRAMTPKKSLSWTVSIPLSEHRNFDLFSQSALEQTHEGQAQ